MQYLAVLSVRQLIITGASMRWTVPTKTCTTALCMHWVKQMPTIICARKICAQVRTSFPLFHIFGLMLNVKAIIVPRMTSHCVGTVQMREGSESGARKWEEMSFWTTAEEGERGGSSDMWWKTVPQKSGCDRRCSVAGNGQTSTLNFQRHWWGRQNGFLWQ